MPADGQAHLLRLNLAQQLRDTREGGGVFCKALPDLVPTALALSQPFGSGELTVFAGIELELFFPGGGKDCPLLLAAALLEGRWIRHPLQEVTDRIRNQVGVEVFRLQPLAAQLLERHGGHFSKSTAESCFGALIASKIKANGITGA